MESDNFGEVLSVGCSVQDYSDEVFHEGSWESKLVKKNQPVEQWSAGDKRAEQEDRGLRKTGVKLRGLAGDKWRPWETRDFGTSFSLPWNGH